jgi:H+/Cl- antiporter ClcA
MMKLDKLLVRNYYAYLVLNWAVSFAIFVVGYYVTPLANMVWDWAKFGWCFVWYWVSGLAGSLIIAAIIRSMKYLKKWPNLVVYRPLTAFISAAILAVGFGWLFPETLSWDKSFVWLLITKLFVIGIGYAAAMKLEHKVGVKFTHDLLEVS